MMKFTLCGGLLVTLALTLLATEPVSCDVDSMIETCSENADSVTEELKKHYRGHEFPDDPVTHCLMHCIGTGLQLYDDESGPDLHAHWEFLGRPGGDEEEFKRTHATCLESAGLDGYEDKCEKAFRAYDCFKDEFETFLHNEGAEKSEK